MSLDSQRAGFHRVTQIMIDMMESVQVENKKKILDLSDVLAEAVSDFVDVVITDGKVTTDDVQSGEGLHEGQIEELTQEIESGSQKMRDEARKQHSSER